MATHNPPPGVTLPRLAFTEGYLGPQAKFDAYGLSLVSHNDPMIYLADDQPEVEIIMGVPAGCRITIKMASLDYQKECNEYCLIRALGTNYLFLLRPPMPGFYKFQVIVQLFFLFCQYVSKENCSPNVQYIYNVCAGKILIGRLLTVRSFKSEVEVVNGKCGGVNRCTNTHI